MKTLKFIPIVLAVLALSFNACKKEAPSGSFKVKMTDSPGDYAALNVQITGVDAYLENSGWVTLSNDMWFFNVLSLTNGKEINLASATQVSAGKYTKLRIRFGNENQLTLQNSVGAGGVSAESSTTVSLAWETSKEMIIEIDQQVSVDGQVEILLDFHVAQSIKEIANKYILSPVITVVKDVKTGLQGAVDINANVAVVVTNGQDTYSTYVDANGNFLIRGLKEGTYTLKFIPESAIATGEKVINGVVVTKGEVRNVGTVQF